MRVMLDGTESSSTVATAASGTFTAPPTWYARRALRSVISELSIFIERSTFSPLTLTCPSCVPTSRLRISPAICAAERPAPAARDGSTVISIWRPALTRSLFTLLRSSRLARAATIRSDALSTSTARSPVMITEMALEPALKPTSSIVTVQPSTPIGSSRVARRSLAAISSVLLARRSVMRAAFGARPVVAAISVCVPVAFSPGMEVVTSSTSLSASRRAYASRLRSRTRSVEVPSGGFTVTVSTFSLPLFRNCVGIWLTSDVAPANIAKAIASVASLVARRRSARPRIGR